MKRTNPVLLALAIILTSCIIKTPLTAVASLLDRIQAALGLSSSAAGLLNSLPLLAFAIVSLFISQLAQRCGAGRVCFAGMACSAVGILCCAALGKAGLYGGMLLIGISIAVGSVLLPAVIKAYFPTKIGPMTSIFTTAMSVMPGIAGGVSVPLAKAVSWNFSLGIWAVVALITMLLWLPNLRCSIVAERKTTGSAVRRSGISWWITLHCGISALLFYSLLSWMATIVQSKGFDAQTAGFYSSLFVLIGIPGSFLIPILANRMRRQSALGICVGALYFSGILLLILARSSASVLCAMLLCGVGTSTVFSFGIASFSIHTENAADAAALSGMAQSLGYFLGAVGPFALGKVFSLASNWTIPLAMLLAFAGLEILVGYMAGRPIVIPAASTPAEKL